MFSNKKITIVFSGHMILVCMDTRRLNIWGIRGLLEPSGLHWSWTCCGCKFFVRFCSQTWLSCSDVRASRYEETTHTCNICRVPWDQEGAVIIRSVPRINTYDCQEKGCSKITPGGVQAIIYVTATILPLLPPERDPGRSQTLTTLTMIRKTEFRSISDMC